MIGFFRAFIVGLVCTLSVLSPDTSQAQAWDDALKPYGPYGPDLRDSYRQNRSYGGGNWGCRARNPRTGQTGSSWDYSTRQAAANRALRECGRGCRITRCG
jgi:Domain of unknown function (DUF4189)